MTSADLEYITTLMERNNEELCKTLKTQFDGINEAFKKCFERMDIHEECTKRLMKLCTDQRDTIKNLNKRLASFEAEEIFLGEEKV